MTGSIQIAHRLRVTLPKPLSTSFSSTNSLIRNYRYSVGVQSSEPHSPRQHPVDNSIALAVVIAVIQFAFALKISTDFERQTSVGRPFSRGVDA